MTERSATTVPVLVTGASSGLGREFAHRFAGRGHDLVIVARRVNRLEALADELQAAHGVTVTPLGADLETVEGRDAVAAVLRKGKRAWILVNNAGFGTTGRFAAADQRREAAEVAVNVVAVQQLTAAVLPGCVTKKSGGIINVASTAAYQPIPYMATYAATKAFVLHFTEALAVELHGSGVHVLALCPGPVLTEFGRVAGNEAEMRMAFPMDARKCVDSALKAYDRNRTVCIPGALNSVMAGTVRVAPRAVVRRVAGTIFKR